MTVTTATGVAPAAAPRALVVERLHKQFELRGRRGHRTLTAVDDVSFSIAPGETVALVGESGSGKSTLARCLTRLVEPTSGEVRLRDTSVTDRPRDRLFEVYRELQMVFQDPTSSLDPRLSVRATLDEPLRLHTSDVRSARAARIRELLDDVELPFALLDRLPRQLSGGQRQRLGIARALAADPSVIVLDEPTASLDVSVRGQIIRLLERLQQEKGLSYLFISHDLGVVRRISHRVLVMYLGAIVEQGPTEEVFDRPTHPYTRALLSAIPHVAIGPGKERVRLRGETPSPIDLPVGCRLASRCPLAIGSCRTSSPTLLPVTPDHEAACPVVLGLPDPPAADRIA